MWQAWQRQSQGHGEGGGEGCVDGEGKRRGVVVAEGIILFREIMRLVVENEMW